MKITMTNDFHNTQTNIITADGWLSHRQVARAWGALCGIDGCTCGGGELGERGRQDHAVIDRDTRPGARPIRVGNYEDRI